MTRAEAITKLKELCFLCERCIGCDECDECEIVNAAEAIEKRTPMKPVYKEKTSIVHESYNDGTSGIVKHSFTDYFCPVCDWVVGERFNHPHFKKGYHDQRRSNYCNQCGQAIDWEDEEDGRS